MNRIISLFAILVIYASSIEAQNVERYKKYHDKGRLLILEGKYQEAISQLDTAINIIPHYARIFQDRGYAYMQVKKYKQAIRDFDHVLKKQPYLNEVKLQRGMALYHLNYLDNAERDLLSIRKARPDKNIEAEYYLESINKEKELPHKEHENLDVVRHKIELLKLEKTIHRDDIFIDLINPYTRYNYKRICKEKELLRYKEERINLLRHQVESRRLMRARHREGVIRNTVVPLAFWTSVFLTW